MPSPARTRRACLLLSLAAVIAVRGSGSTTPSPAPAEVVVPRPRLDHLGSVRVAQCPKKCSCTLTTWDCDNANLTAFPRNIPKTIMALNLFNNPGITSIPVGELHDFTRLRVVDLRNNSITHLSPGTFRNCRTLSEILLSFNRLQDIRPQAFQALPSLRILRLDHNNLTRLVNGTFAGAELPFVQEIRLRENRFLNVIEPGTFWHLPRLRRIQMYRTNMTTDVFGTYDVLTGTSDITFAPGCDQLAEIELGVLKLRALYPTYFHSTNFLQIVNRVGQDREKFTTDLVECDALSAAGLFTDTYGAAICTMSQANKLTDAPSRREKSHLPEYQAARADGSAGERLTTP